MGVSNKTWSMKRKLENFKLGAPQPPLLYIGGPKSRIFCFHPILMKLRTKGFPSVLKTEPKKIFPYDPPPPSPTQWGGGEADSQSFCFNRILMKLGTRGFSSGLNTKSKKICPYDPPNPKPPLGGVVWGLRSRFFCFHWISMKIGIRGFSSALNTKPKIIFLYNPPAPPPIRKGAKISNFLFSSDFDETRN